MDAKETWACMCCMLIYLHSAAGKVRWATVNGYAVGSHTLQHTRPVSLEVCQDTCLSNAVPCLSVDYGENRDCYKNGATASTATKYVTWPPGAIYSHCTMQTPMAEWTWISVQDRRLDGYDIGGCSIAASAEECRQSCKDRAAQVGCRSVDYHSSTGECCLGSVSGFDDEFPVTSMVDAIGWTFYDTCPEVDFGVVYGAGSRGVSWVMFGRQAITLDIANATHNVPARRENECAVICSAQPTCVGFLYNTTCLIIVN